MEQARITVQAVRRLTSERRHAEIDKISFWSKAQDGGRAQMHHHGRRGDWDGRWLTV